MKGIARVYDLGNGPYFKSFEQFCAQVGSQVTPVKHPILHDGAEGAGLLEAVIEKSLRSEPPETLMLLFRVLPVLNTCLK